ncbi:MAG: hypothetical protein VB087_07990 [Candidatus Limiplasma sp.]|nr:hypothetical protein [Candidatus Limiplasma sp.]MEA5144910.1 hypothetical protein [Candidatus Limiplasma sp.]
MTIKKIAELCVGVKTYFESLLKRLFTRDVWRRALKTFWQTALGTFSTLVPAMTTLNGDVIGNSFMALLTSAIAAGASAVWNGVLSPVFFPPTPDVEDNLDINTWTHDQLVLFCRLNTIDIDGALTDADIRAAIVASGEEITNPANG